MVWAGAPGSLRWRSDRLSARSARIQQFRAVRGASAATFAGLSAPPCARSIVCTEADLEGEIRRDGIRSTSLRGLLPIIWSKDEVPRDCGAAGAVQWLRWQTAGESQRGSTCAQAQLQVRRAVQRHRLQGLHSCDGRAFKQLIYCGTKAELTVTAGALNGSSAASPKRPAISHICSLPHGWALASS